jgi:uncharacterized protein with HEPN domain
VTRSDGHRIADIIEAADGLADWTGFIGLRNVLVHAYHRVDAQLLWQAATVDVPRLADALRSAG